MKALPIARPRCRPERRRLWALLSFLSVTLALADEPAAAKPAPPPPAPLSASALRAGVTLPPPDAAELASYHRDLAQRLEGPMCRGEDVSAALTALLAARELRNNYNTTPDPAKLNALYRAGFEALRETQPLPLAKWPANPKGVTLELGAEVVISKDLCDTVEIAPEPGVSCRIAKFKVGELQQYGVVLQPRAPGQYPVILFMHGAAFGVPTYSLPWLARLAAEGYLVAAPALRGEDLFTHPEVLGLTERLRCDGEIENLLGEVDDALAMADGALRLPTAAGPRFAIVGHSFGSGAGLLAAARSERVACVVSYDAWLVNPFRYYWDRLRDGANNWLSWEDYLKQPVADQLTGLMARSIVHHAERVQAPLLLFMGGQYHGSVFHQSHQELVNQLKAHKKSFVYEIVPGGGHNFVLYARSGPALYAYDLQQKWLRHYHPPRAATVP